MTKIQQDQYCCWGTLPHHGDDDDDDELLQTQEQQFYKERGSVGKGFQKDNGTKQHWESLRFYTFYLTRSHSFVIHWTLPWVLFSLRSYDGWFCLHVYSSRCHLSPCRHPGMTLVCLPVNPRDPRDLFICKLTIYSTFHNTIPPDTAHHNTCLSSFTSFSHSVVWKLINVRWPTKVKHNATAQCVSVREKSCKYRNYANSQIQM